jgi:hypothetical protein
MSPLGQPRRLTDVGMSASPLTSDVGLRRRKPTLWANRVIVWPTTRAAAYTRNATSLCATPLSFCIICAELPAGCAEFPQVRGGSTAFGGRAIPGIDLNVLRAFGI